MADIKSDDKFAAIKTLGREFMAEFLGCFVIVFIGCGSVSSGNTLLSIALCFGTAVYVLIESFGDVSGAHFNPAVTLTIFLVAGLPPFKVPLYFAAQFLGAIAGGGILKSMVPNTSDYNSGLGIPDGITSGQAFAWEFMGTLAIIMAVLLIAVRPGQHIMHPGWPIGLTVFFCIAVHGPYTGAGINPARSIGAAMFQEGWWETRAGDYWWVYVFAPFAASLFGPLLVYTVYDWEHSGMSLKSVPALKDKYKHARGSISQTSAA